MKPEIKKLWVDALPRYEQGIMALRVGDEFCCLGVLCDLYDHTNWKPVGHGWWFDGRDFDLPASVMDWAGLEYHDPLVGERTLSWHNDSGKTFTEIAALIDEHL